MQRNLIEFSKMGLDRANRESYVLVTASFKFQKIGNPKELAKDFCIHPLSMLTHEIN